VHAYYSAGFPITDELYHHGIIGQKWGVRRYQNSDGTLTDEGKARYYPSVEKKKSNGLGAKLSNVGGSIKRTAGRYVDHVKLNIKKNHPWMMTDSQLSDVVNRMSMEKRLRELQKDERASRFINRMLRNAEDITVNNTKEFGRSFSNTSGKLIAEKMFKKKEKNKDGNDNGNKNDDKNKNKNNNNNNK